MVCILEKWYVNQFPIVGGRKAAKTTRILCAIFPHHTHAPFASFAQQASDITIELE
jgi:hypothetical protein